ncbi:MAG: hypothetical protein V3U24_08610 [Candidatus Neomarinimicrobiota bacterium]
MKMKGMLIPALSLSLLTQSSYAQLGWAHHEPDLNWRTIPSEHFFVHHPAGYEELGMRVTALCEEVYHPISQSLNYHPGVTHVVVHTRSDIPGGVVSSLPWRIELYPPEPHSNTFGSGSDWLRLLIIHEFTHIVHLRKREGLSNLAYPLFGDFGALFQETVPRWFTEGIATLNETRYTTGGRGRTPFHWMQMAAPIRAGNPWPLENTSYPSRKRAPQTSMQYISGYYLSFYVTRQYGSQAWAGILDRYSKFPFLGFGHAVKSVTKKRPQQIYEELITQFHDPQAFRETRYPEIDIWQQPTIPEDQLSPRWRDENHLVFYRRSLDDLEELTEVNRTGMKRRIVQRILAKQDNSFTLGKDVIVWSELHPHPRFMATVYSDLRVFDRGTKEMQTLTEKARIFNPDLSPDESQVVAVQTLLPITRLVSVDLENGNIKTLLEIPGATLLNPRWSPDGEHITLAVKDSAHRQNIAVLNTKTGYWDHLYSPNRHHDNNPCWSTDGKYVLYASDESGVFNIWAVEVASGKRWMVTDANLGAFTPDVSPGGDELAFSVYTHTGFTIATMSLDSTRWIKRANVEPAANPMIFQGKLTSYEDSTRPGIVNKQTLAYRPWTQLVLPQAWSPYFLNLEQFQALCLYVTSRDVLHRHAWQGSLGFTANEFRPLIDWSYTYSRFWPEFQLRTYAFPEGGNRNNDDKLWVKKGAEVALSLPLFLERNVYTTFFQPFFRMRHQSLEESQTYRGIRLGLNWTRTGQAPRDIAPHKALFLSLFAGWSIPALGSDFTGRQFFNQADIFFPGPVPHHQIHLSQRYHNRDNRGGNFSYPFYGALPTGYNDDKRSHQLRLRLAYVFPVAYLEWSIPILPIYVDFLDAALFYDWGSSWNKVMEPDDLLKGERSSKGVQATMVSYLFQKVRVRLGVAVFYHSKDREWKTVPVLQYKLGL